MKPRNSFTVIFSIAVLAAAILLSAGVTFCEKYVDEKDTYYDHETGDRVVGGLRFRVAEDRRIEDLGAAGVIPEDWDKYHKRKFERTFDILNNLIERISALEVKIGSLADKIDNPEKRKNE